MEACACVEIAARDGDALAEQVPIVLQITNRPYSGAGAVLVRRATNTPEEARALGVLDSDVETLRATSSQLAAADRDQEAMLAARPRTTRTHNATAARILDGIRAIAGAGVAAFALEPRLRARFDALDNLTQRKKAKKRT